jgi:meso-butanediol dehydrogenase / (S,S)-butanediol dehydrogenase / diacetyl reductase
MRFNAKIAVVTGAGGGLNSLYAQMLAREGARVVAVDRAAEGVEKTAALIREAGDAYPVMWLLEGTDDSRA